MQSETRNLVLLAALIAVLGFIWLRGCGGYGAVSREAYEHATALYAICNRRDAARLDTFMESMESRRESGQISEKESEWLKEIAEIARGGDWERATAMTRQMLEDQVTGGP